jgi:hypothetical protein
VTAETNASGELVIRTDDGDEIAVCDTASEAVRWLIEDATSLQAQIRERVRLINNLRGRA